MDRKLSVDRTDLYTRITDKIADELSKGVRPWMKPWSAGTAAGRITRPIRHNGLPYSGLNILLLWSEATSRGFASSMWMTFKQALQLGACVRKGETGTPVVVASRFTKSEPDGHGSDKDREIPFLKAYTAFNVDQVDGLPDAYYQSAEPPLKPMERIDEADRFFRTRALLFAPAGTRPIMRPQAITSRCHPSRLSGLPVPTLPCSATN